MIVSDAISNKAPEDDEELQRLAIDPSKQSRKYRSKNKYTNDSVGPL